ncbi:MAG: hypothetical protein AB7N24_23780 [Dehalococcoidia bacterium]
MSIGLLSVVGAAQTCAGCAPGSTLAGANVVWLFTNATGINNGLPGTCSVTGTPPSECSWSSCTFKGTLEVTNNSTVGIDVTDPHKTGVINGLAPGASITIEIAEEPGCGNGAAGPFTASGINGGGFQSSWTPFCHPCTFQPI